MDDRMSVIVVDDEEGMREGIARILKKQGLDVDTAPDGESAIELMQNRTYDLAFVDLKMPGIDGFKVTEFINEKTDGRTVVVIVSALATVKWVHGEYNGHITVESEPDNGSTFTVILPAV